MTDRFPSALPLLHSRSVRESCRAVYCGTLVSLIVYCATFMKFIPNSLNGTEPVDSNINSAA